MILTNKDGSKVLLHYVSDVRICKIGRYVINKIIASDDLPYSSPLIKLQVGFRGMKYSRKLVKSGRNSS